MSEDELLSASLESSLVSHVPRGGWFGWDRLPVVLDTNVLLSDCEHVSRKGRSSFLLGSAMLPAAHLFATERVRGEVERHLEAYAVRRGLDPAVMEHTWREKYLPAVRFVEVAGEATDPRTKALHARDATDTPTGLLAELLAPCLVFSRDRDLLDGGIARREWVSLSSAASHVGELQAVYGGGAMSTFLFGSVAIESGRGLARAAKAAPVIVLLVGALATYLLYRHWGTERAASQRDASRKVASDVGRRLGEIWTRADDAERLLEAAAFVPDAAPELLQQASRAVAVAAFPLRAAEVGERLGISTQKTAYMLRAPWFTRTADGRYLLGTTYAIGVEMLPAITD